MSTSNLSSSALADPRLWRDLAHTVRRRIDDIEVEDVVQATLTEALAAKALPTAEDGVRRFVFAIARQKVADVYRRRERERRRALREWTATETQPPNDLRYWVERILPKAPSTRQTFDWMLREAEGETLAEIAEADRVSAPMVRQRVSRLRRWLRARWAKEALALMVLAILAIGLALATLRGEGASVVDRGIRRDESVPSAQPAPTSPEPQRLPEPDPAPAELVPPRLRVPFTPVPPKATPTTTKSVTPPSFIEPFAGKRTPPEPLTSAEERVLRGPFASMREAQPKELEQKKQEPPVRLDQIDWDELSGNER